MKNSKRIFAALLAATMIFTSIGNDVISHVNAAETEGPEILAEASETEEHEIPAETSEETLAFESGMDMKQPESEKTKERSEQDDAASEVDASKEQTEEAEDLPNDSWNLKMIHADTADTETAKEGTEENRIKVAVLDSGIEAIYYNNKDREKVMEIKL